VTLYNNRIYRIKDVDFESNPLSKFKHYCRDGQVTEEFDFQHYYRAYYQKEISEVRQPLLVAYPEKDTETVKLVPELCAFLGFNDEMRKDKALLTDGLKHTKVSPQDRLGSIREIVNHIGASSSPKDQDQPQRAAVNKLALDWKLTLSKQPEEVEATLHEPLEVCFGQKKYTIEEGNFQKWMRNGLQCPTKLDDWLFIYPEADAGVLDVWLRSLRDIAQVAFAMNMAEPQRIVCTEQRREIVSVLEKRLTPKTQMVLLLTPQKDSKRVYELFKHTTVATYPCITQVVKSETIRKRSNIAAVLSRIVLQINAKFCGPLWHIDLEGPVTAPLMTVPTMVIGLDIYQSVEGETSDTFLGFAASLDTRCAEYFSVASRLDRQDWRGTISEKIQEFLREALLHFARRNSKMLPEHFIVYRASSSEDQWPYIRQTEVEAFDAFFLSMSQQNVAGQEYTPKLTFVAISKQTHMRFFAQPEKQPGAGQPGTVKNAEPGTIIDVPLTSRPDAINFYLINQAAGKTSASPSHYVVLHDTAGVRPAALQSLTYRLSYMYFNSTGSIKIPAPAQYAKKIAHLIGTAVRTDPHKRLLSSFFFL
jgi:aubergine-like protein